MSVVIALIGIINTMSLSILERRRELGLLRIIGMIDKRVHRMVSLESVLISLLGTLGGLILGLVVSLLLLVSINRLSDATVTPTIPGSSWSSSSSSAWSSASSPPSSPPAAPPSSKCSTPSRRPEPQTTQGYDRAVRSGGSAQGGRVARLACVLALVLGATLTVAGCGEAKLEDAEKAPDLGACRVLTPEDVAEPSNTTEPVDCTEPHTAETFAVGELPQSFEDAEYDDPDLGAWAYKTCSKAFMSFLGADESLVMRTIVSWAWFRPTEDAWDDGARWYRCDVIGGGEQSKEYVELPGTAKGLLSGRMEDRWMVCADGPTVSGSVKVPCTEPHEWRAVTTISIGDEDEKYPGDRLVEVTTREYCSEVRLGLARTTPSTTSSATRGSTRPSGRRATAGPSAGRRPTCEPARGRPARAARADRVQRRRARGPAAAVGVQLPHERPRPAAVPPPPPLGRARPATCSTTTTRSRPPAPPTRSTAASRTPR